MISSRLHENTVVAIASQDIMDEEDDDDDAADDDDDCHGEDNDGEEEDVSADDIVNDDGNDDVNDGATIDSAVVVDTGNTNATGTEAARKKREKAKALLKQVKFARKCTLDQVVFTSDNKDIISIAGIPIKGWNAHMLPSFCRGLKINIPNKARTKKDCVSYIINYKKNGDVREQLTSVGKRGGKKKAAATNHHHHHRRHQNYDTNSL